MNQLSITFTHHYSLHITILYLPSRRLANLWIIVMKMNNETPLNTRHFLKPRCLEQYLTAFSEDLAQKGFTSLTINSYFNAVVHFGSWLQKQDKSIINIDLNCIGDFAKHPCNCFGARQKKHYLKNMLNVF